MGKKLLLEVDQPTRDAHLSSEVKGTVVVETKKDKKYKAVEVTVCGVASTDWDEELGEGDERHTVHYHTTKKYGQKTIVLWTNEHSPDNRMEKGEYKFPFSIKMDGHVPSTYEEAHGRIHYELTAAIVKIDPDKDKKTVSEKISVYEHLDLNAIEGVREPMTKQDEKTICCLCCASGPISLTARIPRTGFFCEKDKIDLEVDIENGSSRAIENLSAKLLKQVRFAATNDELDLHSSRHLFETVVEVTSDPVGPHSSLTWTPDNLILPKTDPTNTSCSFISVKYLLKVEAEIALALDLTITFPLVLGTVPLQAQ